MILIYALLLYHDNILKGDKKIFLCNKNVLKTGGKTYFP